MEHITNNLAAILGLHDAPDLGIPVRPPISYDKWPVDQKKGGAIPDLLPYDDERAGLLIHILTPSWASDPDLFTESKFAAGGLKLDTVDKKDIEKVRCLL